MIINTVVVLPILLYYRIQSQSTREKLDRRQEGVIILLTLRPVGIAAIVGLLAFMINPAWMAWSSVLLPRWLRWGGVVLGAIAGGWLVWTFRTLGPNLTDTVVTRRVHTLVITGPYSLVRHPFYVGAALAWLANALTAANWFVFVTAMTALALLVVRTRREEERLLARFGDAYRDYAKSTGRFLPRLRTRRINV